MLAWYRYAPRYALGKIWAWDGPRQVTVTTFHLPGLPLSVSRPWPTATSQSLSTAPSRLALPLCTLEVPWVSLNLYNVEEKEWSRAEDNVEVQRGG